MREGRGEIGKRRAWGKEVRRRQERGQREDLG